MFVTVDTSALLAVLVNEPHKKEIIKHTTDSELQAPASIDAEIGNALSAMLKRNRISGESAQSVIEQFQMIPLRRTGIRLDEAIKLAKKFNLYAYDAYVLDCARQYRTPLLSLDKRIIEVANQINITVLEVTL